MKRTEITVPRKQSGRAHRCAGFCRRSPPACLLAHAAGTGPLLLVPSTQLSFCRDTTLPWPVALAGTLLTVIGELCA